MPQVSAYKGSAAGYSLESCCSLTGFFYTDLLSKTIRFGVHQRPDVHFRKKSSVATILKMMSSLLQC